MSLRNGILSAPLSISEIKSALGESSSVLSTLCKSNKINKWSWYKPQRIAKGTVLTLEERKNDHMGLGLIILAKIKAVISSPSYSLADCLAEIRECDYRKPTGGTTSPYRINDFLNGEHVTSNGYDHNAKSTDADWVDVSLPRANIDYLAFQNFSASIDGTSAGYIGKGDGSFLPLSWIADLTTDWRMAFAVYINNNGDRDTFQFAVSKESLNALKSSTDAVPSFAENEYLRYLLKKWTENTNESTSFTCVPCLINTPTSAQLFNKVVVGSTPYNSVTVVNSTIYAMPSGTKSFTLTLNRPMENYGYSTQHSEYTRLRGNYYMVIPSYNMPMDYLVKGYTDNTGKTIAGWFTTTIRVATTSQGDAVVACVVAYLTRDVGTNKFSYSTPPPSSRNINVTGGYYYTTDGTSRTAYLSAKSLSSSTTYTIAGVTVYGCMLVEGISRFNYVNCTF